MSNAMSWLSVFFASGLAAVFTQNAVMGRGMGMEHLIEKGEDDGHRLFCMLQSTCCLCSSCLFWLVQQYVLPHVEILGGILSPYYAKAYLWPLCMAVVLSAVYFLLFVVTVKIAPFDKVKPALEKLPFACFNTFISGVMLVSASKTYTFPEMLGFAAGSCLGYHAADFFLREGERKLAKREVPPAFQGLPATLMYLSGLALAAYAVMGHKLSGLL